MFNIKFCPQRYSDEIHEALNDIFHENLYDPQVIKHFEDIPEFHLMRIDEDFMEVPRKQLVAMVKKVYEKFPWHFEVKREYYFSQKNNNSELGFEDFFRLELDCLENNTDYGRVITDDEMQAMVYLMAKHYKDNNEREKLKNLYSYVEQCQIPDLQLELALMLLGKDEEHYATMYHDQEDDISDWLDDNAFDDVFNDAGLVPLNEIFFNLLNVSMEHFDLSDGIHFDNLDPIEAIESDIRWLLKQGFARAYKIDSIVQLDFINYALYLTASYEVESLYDYFIKLYFKMPSAVQEITFGDLHHHIIGPSFVKIFNKKTASEFKFLEEKNEENWYIKSIYLNIIVSLYKHNSQSHFSYHLLKDLFKKYDDDNEMVGWLFSSITDIGCDGFENEIEAAFAKDSIDDFTHGSRDEWKNRSYIVDAIAALNSFDDFIKHAKEHFIKDTVQTFEEELESYISPYKAHDFGYEDFEDDFEEDDFDEDDYDEFTTYDNIVPLWSDGQPFKREESKIGRNDACPCGSGKKYKKCCGKS